MSSIFWPGCLVLYACLQMHSLSPKIAIISWPYQDHLEYVVLIAVSVLHLNEEMAELFLWGSAFHMLAQQRLETWMVCKQWKVLNVHWGKLKLQQNWIHKFIFGYRQNRNYVRNSNTWFIHKTRQSNQITMFSSLDKLAVGEINNNTLQIKIV